MDSDEEHYEEMEVDPGQQQERADNNETNNALAILASPVPRRRLSSIQSPPSAGVFPTPLRRVAMTPMPTPTPPQQPFLVMPTPHANNTPSRRLPRGDMAGGGGASFRLNMDAGIAQPASFLWATNINTEDCMRIFEDFIQHFVKEGSSGEPFYLTLLEEMINEGAQILNLDCSHLFTFTRSRRLYSHLIEFPLEIIPLMDLVINERIVPSLPEAFEKERMRIQVRTFGLKDLQNMRDLDPVNIDQLISIRGMVVRCSSVIPELKQAFFKCALCAHTVEVLVEKRRIKEPVQCEGCTGRDCLQLIHNRCQFSDKQLIRLQESVDEIPEGETPQTVSLFAFDDLVDSVRPGDRVIVTGVFRAIPRKANPRVRVLLRVFKTYMDAVHIKSERVVGSSVLNVCGTNDESSSYSADQINAFEAFAREGNAYERLVQAFAPSIWEMDDVKRGVLCQLLGGTLDAADSSSSQDNMEETKEGDEGNQQRDKVRLRGDINILLCGDPGTSKSQVYNKHI